MDGKHRELATLVSLLQNAINKSSFLRQMAHVWTEIGITEEQRQKRRETILLHTTSLWEEMTTEELALKTKMEASLRTNMREMAELYQQLSLPAEPVSSNTSHKRVLNVCIESNINTSRFPMKPKSHFLKESLLSAVEWTLLTR